MCGKTSPVLHLFTLFVQSSATEHHDITSCHFFMSPAACSRTVFVADPLYAVGRLWFYMCWQDLRPKFLMFGLWPSCHELRRGYVPLDISCQRSILRTSSDGLLALTWAVCFLFSIIIPNALIRPNMLCWVCR